MWHRSTPNARSLSHSPSAPPPSFTQSPYPPRSLVRDEQTHPHRPRLVVSHSTCPPLSSSPHANSFVIGPAVIKHTHTQTSPPFTDKIDSDFAKPSPQHSETAEDILFGRDTKARREEPCSVSSYTVFPSALTPCALRHFQARAPGEFGSGVVAGSRIGNPFSGFGSERVGLECAGCPHTRTTKVRSVCSTHHTCGPRGHASTAHTLSSTVQRRSRMLETYGFAPGPRMMDGSQVPRRHTAWG
jgi:hypothetical protein